MYSLSCLTHTVSTQTQILLLKSTRFLLPYLVLSDTQSHYTNTNIITTIYTNLLPYPVLSDTHIQYSNTNIITTIYTILLPYLVLSHTQSVHKHKCKYYHYNLHNFSRYTLHFSLYTSGVLLVKNYFIVSM